ncbi:uncharacterized protein EI90DRAFT_3130876 [Cantharellus anzutake]|uniref:uncharacterized protein n=1 Tax=Cantharellus anzutake TaxID=1750568 RepID=UPI001903E32C|nr:uncharacterized protein EI90DRAFT_3130876 [Cantharellus anzutake]KAF8322776.1 hypothetical protein EI90DRAFT_3130876 [Cantharellus anzutake]
MSTSQTNMDASIDQTSDTIVHTGPVSPTSPSEHRLRPGVSTTARISTPTRNSHSQPTTPRRRPNPIVVMHKRQLSLQLEEGIEESPEVRQEDLDEQGAGYNDEWMRKEGLAVLETLELRMTKLDKKLQNFTNALGAIGSSAALQLAADDFRDLLTHLSRLFRKNAYKLFGDIDQDQAHAAEDRRSRAYGRGQRRFSVLSDDQETAHAQLGLLADNLDIFLSCLNEIPKFTDQAVNTSVKLFQRDLRYWGSCLKVYEKQYHAPFVRLYLNDISAEIGEHLDSVSAAITVFIEFGIPTIKFTQHHTTAALHNLSTVATLFSSVTATTIQFSYQNFQTRTQEAVNLLWIISLVFSLASAMNSQLAYHWRSAVYRSPRARLPWWVSIWITHTPLSFLIASVIAFSAGLICFTFSNFHISPFIPVVITICTSVSSFALLTVGFWFLGERYAYGKTNGRKWLDDLMKDTFTKGNLAAMCQPFLGFLLSSMHHCLQPFRKALVFLWGLLITLFRRHNLPRDSRQNEIIITEVHSPIADAHQRDVEKDAVERTPSRASSSLRAHRSDDKTERHSLPTTSLQYERSSDEPGLFPLLKPVFEKFHDTLRGFGIHPRTSEEGGPVSSPRTPLPVSPAPRQDPFRGRGSLSDSSDHSVDVINLPPAETSPSNLGAVIPALKSLRVTGNLRMHTALVRDIQFSPNGEYLATCAWDQTAIIWRVDSIFTVHQKLEYAGGSPGQVLWSPDGQYLIVKSPFGVKAWLREVRIYPYIANVLVNDASRLVFGSGPSTGLVEQTKFTVLVGGSRPDIGPQTEYCTQSVKGEVQRTYETCLGPLVLHDVAVTMDELRLLGVATLSQTPDDQKLKPSDSHHLEKRIIVLNLQSEEIETHIPMLHDVRHIKVSGPLVLISFEDKTSPQLFRLGNIGGIVHLDLLHTYNLPSKVRFGRSGYLGQFAGHDVENMVVLSTDMSGKVHFWDRRTTKLLHSLHVREQGTTPASVAWNNANEHRIMLATGGDDGSVRIWTALWNTGKQAVSSPQQG